MYPTPPSLEQQNSAFSPVNQPCHDYTNHGSVQGITQIEHSAGGDFNEIEADENMGSPKPELIQVRYIVPWKGTTSVDEQKFKVVYRFP